MMWIASPTEDVWYHIIDNNGGELMICMWCDGTEGLWHTTLSLLSLNNGQMRLGYGVFGIV